MRTECSCSDRQYDGGHGESIRMAPSDIWRELGKCYCSQVLRSVFAWKTVTQWGTCEYYCHYTTVIKSRQATALNENSFSTPQNSLTVSSSSSTLKNSTRCSLQQYVLYCPPQHAQYLQVSHILCIQRSNTLHTPCFTSAGDNERKWCATIWYTAKEARKHLCQLHLIQGLKLSLLRRLTGWDALGCFILSLDIGKKELKKFWIRSKRLLPR